MSLNINGLAGKVQVAGVSVAQVITILGKVIGFITMVEQLAAELKGSEKFQTVMAMVDTLLHQMDLSDEAEAIKKEIGPIISMIVKIYNFLKLWPVSVATPPTAIHSS